MRVHVTYQQHAVVECEYTLDVPEDIAAKGDEAIREWCDENENMAPEITQDVVDWQDRIDHTFRVEKL